MGKKDAQNEVLPLYKVPFTALDKNKQRKMEKTTTRLLLISRLLFCSTLGYFRIEIRIIHRRKEF